jgi:signal peptidase II
MSAWQYTQQRVQWLVHKSLIMAQYSYTALWFGVVLFCIDVASKYFVRTGDIVSFVCNAGIGLGFGMPQILIIVLSIVIFAAIIFWYRSHCKEDTLWCHVAFAALLAGALSNFGERIIFGCVTDFIPFFGLWTMNLADAYISIGLVIFMWHTWQHEQKNCAK